MSFPRKVIAGATYLVTRRCAQREFLLRPSEATNQVFQFLLAVMANRHKIILHGYCVLSNHVHLLVTDPEARLPDFQRDLNSLVARSLNVKLGRREGFWASGCSYSAVTLLSSTDVLEKAVYVLANPVEAGLVQAGREWPGSWSSPDQIGGDRITLHRPKFFFRSKGPLPETAELVLKPPPGFVSLAAFRDTLVKALAAREEEIRTKRAAEGRGFLGARKVLAQKPTSRPSAQEAKGALNPRIAGRDKWKRIEALLGLVEFRRAYRAAFARLRQGERDVVFPRGTYLLRVIHGVRCEAAA
jgi:REP element-mobilizing transposase RayT